jgi:hypothetical protein
MIRIWRVINNYFYFLMFLMIFESFVMFYKDKLSILNKEFIKTTYLTETLRSLAIVLWDIIMVVLMKRIQVLNESE